MNNKKTVFLGLLVMVIAAGVAWWGSGARLRPLVPAPVATSTSSASVKPVVATPSSPVVVKPVTKPASNIPPAPAVVLPVPSQPAITQYTLAQVATHSTRSSCWSVVNGNVYDLTSWIGQHPGGASAITRMCGKDASSDFNDQHGGQRRPANELAGFLIGPLQS